jgi:transketolase
MVRKFAAFDWQADEVDGHDELALGERLQRLIDCDSHAPRVLLARTVKGKGISFMENNNAWHYGRIDAESYASALAELNH